MELFACSGPGAGATIARNIELGYTNAAVAGGLLLVSLAVAALGTRRWVAPAVLAGLVALHPAWTISAISGDCGFFKRDASLVFTVAGAITLCWQLARGLWFGRRRVMRSEADAERPDGRSDLNTNNDSVHGVD